MKCTSALSVAAAMAACTLFSCGEELAPEPVSIFSDDVGQVQRQLVREMKDAGHPRTTLTTAIEWMPSLDAAFERATAEDKPVLISSYVRENGDPENDV